MLNLTYFKRVEKPLVAADFGHLNLKIFHRQTLAVTKSIPIYNTFEPVVEARR